MPRRIWPVKDPAVQPGVQAQGDPMRGDIVEEVLRAMLFTGRLQHIELDTGYDTRRREPDGVRACVSQTAVYDTC